MGVDSAIGLVRLKEAWVVPLVRGGEVRRGVVQWDVRGRGGSRWSGLFQWLGVSCTGSAWVGQFHWWG